MKKFWRGFRTEAEKIERDEAARVRADQLEKLRLLLEVGGHEAEAEYVQFLKDWKPDIGKGELQERIRQYHAAVNERQSRDRGSR